MANFLSKFVGDLTGATAAEKANAAQQKAYAAQEARLQPLYQAALPGAMQYYSAITGQVNPQTGKVWSPTETPAFKWQQEQAQKEISRKLRAQGRENSTFGHTRLSDLNLELAANEYNAQLGRLGQLEQVARGNLSGLNAITQAQGQSTADLNLAKGAINNQLLMAALKAAGGVFGGALGAMGTAAATSGAGGGSGTQSSLFR